MDRLGAKDSMHTVVSIPRGCSVTSSGTSQGKKEGVGGRGLLGGSRSHCWASLRQALENPRLQGRKTAGERHRQLLRNTFIHRQPGRNRCWQKAARGCVSFPAEPAGAGFHQKRSGAGSQQGRWLRPAAPRGRGRPAGVCLRKGPPVLAALAVERLPRRLACLLFIAVIIF